MKSLLFIVVIILFSFEITAQDSSVFSRITNSVKQYKLDTSNVPDDKVSHKIIELRQLKGGFNINEAIEFKIQEELTKDATPKEELLKSAESFRSGLAKKWLDNAVIWIYRQEFSFKELKKLVKFYKTSAGQKMAKDFPIIMIKSLAAAEIIQKVIAQK